MDLGLQAKRALVLSSSRGLGLGIAQALAAEGASVLMTARSADRLRAAADAINAKGPGRAKTFAGELAPNVDAIHRAALDALGGVDILVANTGGPPARTALGASPDEWTPQFEAMVAPIIRLAGLVLPGCASGAGGAS
jgi:3-oxoacyl-[acyl-carrier protein] reductase